MKRTKLSEAELGILEDYSDVPILEMIKAMSLEEMRIYDCYRPMCMRDFVNLQMDWLEKEKYLVGTHKYHSPSDLELICDIQRYNNGERFRVFYVLKYHYKVIKIE